MLTKRYIDEAFLVKRSNVKVEGVDERGKKRISVFGEHQAEDIVNKNYRTYTKELWDDLLSRKDFLEAEKANRILGFIGHPDFSKGVYLDYSKFSHYTKNIYRQNGIIYATDYPTTSPMGELLTNYLLEDGIQFGISSRGYGESKQVYDAHLGRQIEVMLPGFVLEGFDFVLDPSCYIAFPKVRLESRQYLENWTPVISVFKRVVEETLDENKVDSNYLESYKWFGNQLKQYPNVAVVKNFVTESVDKIIESIDKKSSLGRAENRFFYSPLIAPKSSSYHSSSASSSVYAASSSSSSDTSYRLEIDHLKKERRQLQVMLEAYRHKAESLAQRLQHAMKKRHVVGNGENLMRAAFPEHPVMPKVELDEIEKSDSSKSKSLDLIKPSQAKRLTISELRKIGKALSFLSPEKKQVLTSAIFSDDEQEIENALDELVRRREHREEFRWLYSDNRRKDMMYRRALESYDLDHDMSDDVDDWVNERDWRAVLRAGSFHRAPKLSLAERFVLEPILSSDKEVEPASYQVLKTEHTKKMENIQKTESYVYPPVVVPKGKDVSTLPREPLLSVKGTTPATGHGLPHERFTEYIEGMELSNVESPYPVDIYVVVTKDYDHPASTTRLKRGERLTYKGYFKGNWDYRLEKIAVLEQEFSTFGVKQRRMVTMSMSDFYEYCVPYHEYYDLPDSSLPFSGEVDKEVIRKLESEGRFEEAAYLSSSFHERLAQNLSSHSTVTVGGALNNQDNEIL